MGTRTGSIASELLANSAVEEAHRQAATASRVPSWTFCQRLQNPLQTQGIAETILDNALAQLEVESNWGELP